MMEIDGLFDTMPDGRESRNSRNTAVDRRDNESIKYTRIFVYMRARENA
jgi:hypothetical protein